LKKKSAEKPVSAWRKYSIEQGMSNLNFVSFKKQVVIQGWLNEEFLSLCKTQKYIDRYLELNTDAEYKMLMLSAWIYWNGGRKKQPLNRKGFSENSIPPSVTIDRSDKRSRRFPGSYFVQLFFKVFIVEFVQTGYATNNSKQRSFGTITG